MKSTVKHFLTKLLKTNGKAIILQAAREDTICTENRGRNDNRLVKTPRARKQWRCIFKNEAGVAGPVKIELFTPKKYFPENKVKLF